MTVVQLIQILQTMPQDAMVVTEGYETGYDSIKKVEFINVEEKPDYKWYEGRYDDSDKPDAMQVVFLNALNKEDVK